MIERTIHVMRKFRAWAVMMVMMMAVLVISGCGGGSLDPENSSSDNETEQTIPNNLPDTYNTQKVLEGSWRTLDEEQTFSTYYFSFRLNSATLTFTSTDIGSTVALSRVTSSQEWYTYYGLEDDLYRDYVGLYTLGLDFSGLGAMAHQGKDKWRCNFDSDSNNVVMNITVISETVIDVNFQGVAKSLYNGHDASYNFTLTFRKEDFTR